AQFLTRLGVVQRADALRANAGAAQSASIASELRRLTSTDEEFGAGGRMVPGMGALFKALAIQPSKAPPPPGFENVAPDGDF
ncbi:MAG: hypothetical protein K2Y29_06685, partial [Beijerinckiaceae bacterium]|nr:hypothetical protein [Beijerinckiaceae bacterium]